MMCLCNDPKGTSNYTFATPIVNSDEALSTETNLPACKGGKMKTLACNKGKPMWS